MTTALLTPINNARSRTAAGAGKWRKQILPFRTINYSGRQIKFDRKFMVDLVNSFKSGAYDLVPLQFADGNNSHTNDPDRTRGRLLDLELAKDGLYGLFELGEDGAKVIENNSELGVSARILQDYERPDGKKFPRAIQHVLATVDPKMTGMKPWQKVDLSNDTVTEVIDLSTEAAMPGKNEDEKVVVELSQSDLDVLQQVLSDQRTADAALAKSDDEGTEDTSQDGSEEVEDVPDQDDVDDEEEPGDEEGEEEGPAAPVSKKTPAAATALSNATDDVARNQVLELTNQLRAAEVEREIDSLRNTGLAPAIIEAARPGLELPQQAIELANGETVDPGQVVRDVLHQVVELSQSGHSMVDYDVESGVLVGSDSVQERRKAQLDAWENERY